MAKPGGGLMIALGFGKKKPESGPPSYKTADPDPGDPMESAEATEPGADDQGAGTGLSPEEVNYSSNDNCQDCAHMSGSDCAKYGFPVEPSGHCQAGFTPKDGGGMEMGSEPMTDMGGGGR